MKLKSQIVSLIYDFYVNVRSCFSYLNHSQRQRTANRILRVYGGDKKLSEDLHTLVAFVIRVYDSIWTVKRRLKLVTEASKGDHGLKS